LETETTRYVLKTEKKNRIIIEEVKQEEITEVWNRLQDLYRTL
jgi:hypothetical protein